VVQEGGGHNPGTSLLLSLMDFDAGMAILAMVFAAIGYGSYYVPVKKYNVYDGVVYQWFMCSGIMLAGVTIALARNDWTSTEPSSRGFYLTPEGLLSGLAWQASNVLATRSVNYFGLGNYYIWHELTNLGGTFFVGIFGPYVGIPANAPSSVWLAGLGFLVVFIAMVPVSFMKSESDRSIDGSAEMFESADCGLRVSVLTAEDPHGSFGGMAIGDETAVNESRLNASSWLKGLILALVCGAILSLQYEPMLPWKVKLQKANPQAHITGMDYVFSTCTGIYLWATLYLLLAGGWKRVTNQTMTKSVLRPPLLAGYIWGLSCLCQLYAATVLPYAVAYAVVVGGGLFVSLMWGIFRFGEAKSTHNRKCMAATFLGIFAGVALLGMAA